MRKIDSGLTSAGTWVFAGIILAAKTGLDYRRLKNNEIDESEFKQNFRQNAAGTVGSVIGGAVGMTIGIPVGAYLYNSVGAIVGAAVFGVTGSIIGENVMMSAEEKLNQAMLANLREQETKVPSKMFTADSSKV